MASSSNFTTPDSAKEPLTPDYSDLTSPEPELASITNNNTPQVTADILTQTFESSSEGSVRRSARQRRPTSKLDEVKQAPVTKKSPKRRKTGAGQYVSSLTTVESNDSNATSTTPENVVAPRRLIVKLRVGAPTPSKVIASVSKPNGEADLENFPCMQPAPVQISQANLKKDLERDIQEEFIAKVHGRRYRPRYTNEDREDYFDKHRLPKNRPENVTHVAWKEDKYWPGFNPRKPIYYNARGEIITASSDGDKGRSNQGSEAPSPSLRGSRAAQTGKNGRNGGRGASKPNKSRGAGGGRDRDSPEPPAKPILDQDERLTLAQIRQEQAKLKTFFTAVGGQQKEALDLMISRDLSKLHSKHKQHTKVPEYNEVMQDLQDKESAIEALVTEQYTADKDLAESTYEAQREIISSQFKQRVEEAQQEHVQGAQGDLVIFRKAHLTAKDDTRTNNGSDIEPYFPRYHELPEADAGPRGYTSSHIRDEKPFKEHLTSYDEQANQEVIDDDIVAPVALSLAEDHARRRAAEKQQARLDALVTITREELRQERGYLIPRPRSPPDNPQFALSRLADCAEYIEEYVYMPLAPSNIETFPLNHLERIPPAIKTEDSRPSTSASQSRPASARKPLVQRQKSVSISSVRKSEEGEPQAQAPSQVTPSLPLIAPAPLRRPSLSMQQPSPFTQMPPPPTASIPPSPSQSVSRRSSFAPLLISRPPSATSPPTPIAARPASSIPPPPSPSRFGPPLYPYPAMLNQPPLMTRSGYPVSQPQYHPAQPPPPPAPRFDRPPQSPVDYKPPAPQLINIQHRFPQITNSTSRPRVGGPRREPGQITFTPAQTPDSERFKNPPQPQPLPPGQAVYRPNSLQQLNSARNSTTVVASNPPPPETNSRSQQAADVARQTASINQGQGAGPKGGRRILLPKRY